MDQTGEEQTQIPVQDDIEGNTVPGESVAQLPEAPAPGLVAAEQPVVVPSAPQPKAETSPFFSRPKFGLAGMAGVVADKPHRNTLVLQWLTYVFWWWFVAASVWMVGVLADILVTGAKPMTYTGSALAVPAIVMIGSLIVAVVADTLYSRREDMYGGRASHILQTVHGVVFAVTIVASIITVLYYLLGGVFGAGYTADGKTVALITSFTSIVLYGLVFARIMFPATKGWARTAVMGVLAVAAVVLVGVALSGPAARARDTRDDALIEDALTALADKIDNYATDSKTLPSALSKLDFSEENSEGITNNDKAKDAVKKGLIEYTANTQSAATTSGKYSSSYYSSSYSTSRATTDVHFYRLCATFKTVKKGSRYDPYYATSDSATATTPDVAKHEKGKKCYELKTIGGSANNYGPYSGLEWGAGVDSSTDTSTGAGGSATSTKSSSATTTKS